MVDSGYRNLAALRTLGQTGRFWIIPPSADLVVRDAHGVARSLKELLQQQASGVVDLDVQPGVRERLPVRLIAVRVPAQQAERRRLGAAGEISLPPKGARRPNARKHSALTQAGTRDIHAESSRKRRRASNARLQLLDWNIILTNVPREKPECILTEILAKWLGLLISHWVMLVECWQDPHMRKVEATMNGSSSEKYCSGCWRVLSRYHAPAATEKN